MSAFTRLPPLRQRDIRRRSKHEVHSFVFKHVKREKVDYHFSTRTTMITITTTNTASTAAKILTFDPFGVGCSRDVACKIGLVRTSGLASLQSSL